jgi:predicted O-methyltransferase YrrM
MTKADEVIWKHFRIKRNDCLPYTGWAGGRDTFPEIFKELGFKVGAEIGTRKGHYAKILCSKDPELKLYCVDPWRAFARNSQERIETHFEEAKKNLAGLNVEFVRKSSVEGLNVFEDESLDFVYIDALHSFNAVMLDIIGWQKKVKIGGIVSGHDYFQFYQSGVVKAIDAYTAANSISPWYVSRQDREPSWFYVKTCRCYDEEYI